MRPILVATTLAALAAVPAHAFDDPGALLEAVYAPYLEDDFHDETTAFFAAPIRAELEASGASVGGYLGADPFINGQDFDIGNLVIGKPAIEGGVAEVEVRFENFGEPNLLSYVLVREEDGWKIADIVSTGEFGWALSAVIAEGPMF